MSAWPTHIPAPPVPVRPPVEFGLSLDGRGSTFDTRQF